MSDDTKTGCWAFLFLLIVCGSVLGCVGGYHYLQSKRAAQIYNQLHNTNYTTFDFFWASDQINKSTSTLVIQPLERK